jgi:hypothetical protein
MLEILLLIVSFTIGAGFGYICRRAFIIRTAGYTGIILITEDDEKTIFTLELDGDPEELADQDEVIFKVKKVSFGEKT